MRPPSLDTLRALALKHRWKLAGALGAWVAWLLFGWFAVPMIAAPRIERAVTEATGHPTTLGLMEFDPLRLAVTLHDLRIATPGADETVIAVQRLHVDFETRSLVDRAWNFKALELDQPFVNAVLRADGTLNLVDLAGPPSASAPTAEPAPAAAMPRVIVQSFVLAGGEVAVANDAATPPLRASFPNLALSLTDFSTLPDERGEYALQLRGPAGGLFIWRGSVGVNPIASEGRFTLEGASVPGWFDLVGDRLAWDLVDGTARATVDYALAQESGRLAFRVTDAALTVEQLALAPRDGAPLVKLPRLEVAGVKVDLPARDARVGEVRLEGLEVALGRDVDGLDLPRLFAPAPAAPAAASDTATAATSPPAPAPAARPWRVALDRIAFTGARIALTDRTLPEPATLAVAPLDLALTEVALGPETRFTVALDATINGAGKVSVRGPLVGAAPAGTLALKVEGLAFAPFQPWISPVARLDLVSGALGVDATLALAPPGMQLKGYAEVGDLKVRDARHRQDLLRWKRLQLKGLDLALAPRRLRIDEIVAEQPYLRFLIGADGTTNLQGLMVEDAGQGPAAGPERIERPAAPKGGDREPVASAPLPIEVRRVRVLDGSANFADLSLQPDFATGIQQLTGSITGLSSQEAKRAEIVLDGKVDKYAPVAIRGRVNLLAADAFSDVTLSFKDIELTTFTPYSGKFAGYKIDKGRLSLDIRYQLEDRYIRGQHKVVLDQLTLGERVESADAMSLPIKLALALLKDSRGVIDLDLPVEGSLDDPQFKVGPLVWKAVVSLFTKVVTAPFAALGALFGGDQDLSTLAFAAGSASLDPAATARLDALAKGLLERPALRLDVRGAAAPGADGVPLARQRVLTTLRPDGSATTLVALTPKELKALLAMHAARFGDEPAVPGLAEGQKPTPEQLHEAALARLAEADGPAPEALRALAQARAAAMKDYLVTRALVPAERVFLLDAETTNAAAAGQPVELSLVLSAAE